MKLYWLLMVFSGLGASRAWADGSIHNHLTLDLLPLATSPNVPSGAGAALSYDRYFDLLKTSYAFTAEEISPFQSTGNRTDIIGSLGFLTQMNPAFSIGARVGIVTNNPSGYLPIGALALRLPALAPEAKEFFSFFFEEVDLGLAGSGNRYATVRLGMKLL